MLRFVLVLALAALAVSQELQAPLVTCDDIETTTHVVRVPLPEDGAMSTMAFAFIDLLNVTTTASNGTFTIDPSYTHLWAGKREEALPTTFTSEFSSALKYGVAFERDNKTAAIWVNGTFAYRNGNNFVGFGFAATGGEAIVQASYSAGLGFGNYPTLIGDSIVYSVILQEGKKEE